MFIEIPAFDPSTGEKEDIVINLNSIVKCKWVDGRTIIHFTDGSTEIILHDDSIEFLNFLEIAN